MIGAKNKRRAVDQVKMIALAELFAHPEPPDRISKLFAMFARLLPA